jgi:hypothetical protein
MATRSVSRTDLVGVSSVAWMRAVRINFVITETKPQTVLYPFFDGKSIALFTRCHETGSTLIKTDDNGRCSGFVDIPPFTFNTGSRILKFQEEPKYNPDSLSGATLGSASATFTTSAVRQTLQQTTDTFVHNVFYNQISVIDPPPPPPPRGDPLAQSFFTHGVNGGCFVTEIDIFFRTKDDNIPIVCQIRELVAGVPGDNWATFNSSVSLNPSSVALSDNASIPTTFRFSTPIYLPQNRDWCFVLLSNSNKYTVFTSKLGEKSIETGKTIFEQPHIGSLFKSENNATWTAEQTEDIKFTMRKAKFDTTKVESLQFNAQANTFLIYGNSIQVEDKSPKIKIKFEHQHGLRPNDYIEIKGQADAVYRGIPSSNISSQLNTDFPVSVVDPYTIEFIAKSSATSTGTLESPGIINSIIVDDGGFGYTNPTIIIDAPQGGGTRATAKVHHTGGVITHIEITNKGSGYTFTPSYTLSDPTAAGIAKLAVISESIFEVTTNNVAHGFKPLFPHALTPDTNIKSRLKTTNSNYGTSGFAAVKLDEFHAVNEHSVILSGKNQSMYLPGQRSTEFVVELESTNENTSPIVLLNHERKIQTFAYSINNFPSYDNIVTVSELPTTGGLANTVYFRTTDNTDWVLSGTQWVAANSEFKPTGGGAYSKYITKQFTLETLSKGARVYVNAASMFQSSFDVYFRTSLSGSGKEHKDKIWTKMNCSVKRNLSKSQDEFLDYEFQLDDIEPFNVYDIKIVMLSSNQAIVPRIANYRVIILAT